MNPKEKILRTELVSAGAALLCCLLLCIACFLLAGLPSASLILLATALPLSLVILPCALTWYSGRFCWAAPIFLTLGFILIPSYFLRGYFLEIGLAGLASGLFAAARAGVPSCGTAGDAMHGVGGLWRSDRPVPVCQFARSAA